MIRVVFDTVVFVRSLINPFSWWGKLLFQQSDTYRLFVSQPVLMEIVEVLNRPEITSLFHTVEHLDKERIIKIISKAETVEVSPIPPASRDVNDDKFIATALTAHADYLVTEDTDLLDLKNYHGVKIITAEKFIQILKQNKE